MYLKWKRQMRLRPQSPPLKSDGWFSSVWELQGLPRSVAVTPAEKGCHRFGMPYILCYFLLPQVKCQPRSVRAQTADEKERGAGCIPGCKGGRRWKSGKTHLAWVWHNLTAVPGISASTHPAWCLTLGKKKKKSKELSSFSPSCSGKKVACLLIQREKDTEIFTDTENKFSVTRRETRWDKLGVWG